MTLKSLKPIYIIIIIPSLLLGNVCVFTSDAEAAFERQIQKVNRERSFEQVQRLSRRVREQADVIIAMEEESRLSDEEGLFPAGGRLFDKGRDQENVSFDWDWEFDYDFERYSNFFGDRNEVKGESVFLYSPTIHGYTRIGDWTYDNHYVAEYSQHRNYTENDRFDHEWTQYVERSGNEMTLSAENLWAYAGYRSDDPGEKPSRFIFNRVKGNLRYQVAPKTEVDVMYINENTKYLSEVDEANNSMIHTVGVDLTHQLSIKTQLFTNYRYSFYGLKKQTKDKDIDTQQMFFGLGHISSRKLTWGAAIGLKMRYFDDVSLHTEGMKTDWIAIGSMRYEFTPKTSLDLKFQRDSFSDTATSGPEDPTTHTVSAAFTHDWTSKIKFLLGQSIAFKQEKSVQTLIDEDNPSDTITKVDKEVNLKSHAGVGFEPTDDTLLRLDYSFDRNISDLKIDNRVHHELNAQVSHAF